MEKRNLIFILVFSVCALGLYLSLDFEKDFSKLSIKVIHTLAKKNDAEAQSMLGYYYQYGVNVEVDLEESKKWYINGAKNGNTDAMVNLGHLYENGIGTEQDSIKAFKWNLKAAKNGNGVGMFNVGKKYEMGIGVEQDKEQARYWLEKAKETKKVL